MMMVTKSLQLIFLIVCSLTIITIECANNVQPQKYEVPPQGPDYYNITKTIVYSAVKKGAVCLDGSPPAYHFDPGFGDGADNWIVHLLGGAWCSTKEQCLNRSRTDLGSSYYMNPFTFQGLFSKNKTANPDFYNWNKVYVRYCDGGAFTGDVEPVDPATNLHYRGARIFRAVLKELLARGLKNAKNAILAGSSAGGYPAMLYCDRFHKKLPNTARVKCLVDCGYFPQLTNDELAIHFDEIFEGLVNIHGSANQLPKSCTSKMKPAKCFHPENIQQHIKTPLFIFMSKFDSVLTQWTIPDEIYNNVQHQNITGSQKILLHEISSDFLKALPKGDNPKHRGVFIDTMHHHTSLQARWSPSHQAAIGNLSAPQAFADWYFDRNYTYVIDEHNLPLPNDVK